MANAAVIKVQCKNLLCKAKPFEVSFGSGDPIQIMKKIKCAKCGNMGVMYANHVLNTEELLRQIESWRHKVPYKKAFKLINYNKLPVSIEQQMVGINKKITHKQNNKRVKINRVRQH